MAPLLEVVEGPPLTEPRVSLLRSIVPDVSPDANPRWAAGGVQFESDGCGGVQLVECGTDDLTDPSEDCNVFPVEAFEIVASYSRHVRSSGSTDFVAKATQKLEACTAKAIEAELWGGALKGDVNPHLTSGTDDEADVYVEDVSVAGNSFTGALAALEDYLAACSCGGMGMIHMTRGTLIRGMLSGAVRRTSADSYRLETPNGTIIVPGAGYPGTDPDGADEAGVEWMYATGPIAVRLSAITVTPPTMGPGDQSQAVDRATNLRTYWASRFAVVGFDPSCCLAGAKVAI